MQLHSLPTRSRRVGRSMPHTFPLLVGKEGTGEGEEREDALEVLDALTAPPPRAHPSLYSSFLLLSRGTTFLPYVFLIAVLSRAVRRHTASRMRCDLSFRFNHSREEQHVEEKEDVKRGARRKRHARKIERRRPTTDSICTQAIIHCPVSLLPNSTSFFFPET